jgi:integrase
VPVLSADELRALFATCKGKTFLERRDFAMLVFLADTGVRVGELVAPEIDDVDFKTGTANVTGKFRLARTVAFGPKAGKALLTYLRVRASHRLARLVQPRLDAGSSGGAAVGFADSWPRSVFQISLSPSLVPTESLPDEPGWLSGQSLERQ